MPKEKLGVKLRKQYNREETPDELLSKFKSNNIQEKKKGKSKNK